MFLEFPDASIIYDPAVEKLIKKVPRALIAVRVLSNKARTGWVIRGIKEYAAETIWQHTEDLYQDSKHFPAELFGLDRATMARLIFCHDMVPETYGPDHPPHKISAAEKKESERKAKDRLVRVLGPASQILVGHWAIYDAKRTPEAKMVGQLDKLNCVVRAMTELDRGIDAREFFDTAKPKITEPFLQWVFAKLEEGYGFEPNPQKFYRDLLGSHDKFQASYKPDVANYPDYLRRQSNTGFDQMVKIMGGPWQIPPVALIGLNP